jgi:hypothetical protein
MRQSDMVCVVVVEVIGVVEAPAIVDVVTLACGLCGVCRKADDKCYNGEYASHRVYFYDAKIRIKKKNY